MKQSGIDATGSTADRLTPSPDQHGLSADAPLPVGSIDASLALLGDLTHRESGQRVLAHRLGCVVGKHGRPVDVYEAVTADGGSWWIFYLDIYDEPSAPNLLPAGFVRVAAHDVEDRNRRITNHRLAAFPDPSRHGIDAAHWSRPEGHGHWLIATGAGRRRVRQHLIDPETCIRCGNCELACPNQAITHEHHYVVDFERCEHCEECLPVCPTDAIANWRTRPRTATYSVQAQLDWDELPD